MMTMVHGRRRPAGAPHTGQVPGARAGARGIRGRFEGLLLAGRQQMNHAHRDRERGRSEIGEEALR